MNNIDIIIPVYRNASLTKCCIESVLTNIHEIEQFSPRLLIINDSPDDKEVSSILEVFSASTSNIELLTNTVNCGFVKSVNRCLKISKQDGRDVILVNSDTETFIGTLSNLIDVAYSDPMIGFVSPRSNNASFCTLPHNFGGILPTPDESHKKWRSISGFLPKFHFTPTAVGFYLFIKNEIISNIGLLREDFGLGYEEENDLILRANKVGYRSVLANHAFAYHAGSASFNLMDMDLKTHQNNNLKKMIVDNPEFLPLVRNYESSSHFRAEKMLTELVELNEKKINLVIDLTNLGLYQNGTNEFAIAVVNSLALRYSDVFSLSVICSIESFKYHGLDILGGVFRRDISSPGTHTISIKLGQPFDVHDINFIESLAPINIYAMLDTIAEDCGYLSVDNNLNLIWSYVADHSNGIIFISKFSENTFCARYPNALNQSKYTRLLPTKLTAYKSNLKTVASKHILVLGNHFKHKSSDNTAYELSKLFPTLQIVVLGSKTFTEANLIGFRSGTLDAQMMINLYSEASIIVLPSYVEGFGFGLLHGLAAHKIIVARNIPVIEEILKTYKKMEGVYLYNNNSEIKQVILSAMNQFESKVDDSNAIGWDEWTDGLVDFCKKSLTEPDLFSSLVKRINRGDEVRKINLYNKGSEIVKADNLRALLKHNERSFIECAYLTLLNRPVDHSGLTHRLEQLKQGVLKVDILLGMQRSPEGKSNGAKIKGLRRLFILNKFLKLPIIRLSNKVIN
jgi:GT2 family glycosyltransferase